MLHKGTQQLETDRLILRRLSIEDAEQMYNNWASEDEVTKFLTWPTHASVDISKMVIEDWIKNYDKNNPKSGRVMQKIGMQYEGTLRGAGACNQGIVDEVWYSILKEDYMEREDYENNL